MSRIFKSKVLVSFLLIFIISVIYIPSCIGDSTQTYKLSANPSDPFEFTVNTPYLTGGILISTGSYYSQVFLNADILYFYYWGADANQLDIKLEKAGGSFTVFDYNNQEWNSYVMLLEVSKSGIYNLTITNSHQDEVGGSFYGTGFFTIDKLTFGQQYSRDYGFTSNQICIAYSNFSVDEYKQGSGTPSYFHLWNPLSGQSSHYYNLNKNKDSTFHGANATDISVAGRYIIYNDGTIISSINEYVATNNRSTKQISGFNPVLIIGLSFAVLLIISYKIKKIKAK